MRSRGTWTRLCFALFMPMLLAACTYDDPAGSSDELLQWQSYRAPQLSRVAPPPRTATPRPAQRYKSVPRHHARRKSQLDPQLIPACGRVSHRWTTIVIHHSATHEGSAACFDKDHRRRGWDELGYHFVIGNGTYTGDGQIEIGSRWQKQKHGAHCKTGDNYFNDHGIGICLVGNFEKERPTRRQMAALRHLVASLCQECDIPASAVTTHRCVTGRTACPGRNFPLDSLRASLTHTTMAASSLP